jgi:organic radical activating enzyme
LAEAVPSFPNNVCLTGGEPMLQKDMELIEFVNLLHKRGHTTEMFTNGTILYPERIIDTVFIVMDWKLPGSGEQTNQWGHKNTVRVDNFHRLDALDAVKFTIADRNDFQVAMDVYEEYWGQAGWLAPAVYAGIVWDKEVTNEQLVEWILEDQLPWRLNVQVHNHVWDRSKRGI